MIRQSCSFSGLQSPGLHLIGVENAGFIAIMSISRWSGLSLAIMAYMTAQLAYEEALRYVKGTRGLWPKDWRLSGDSPQTRGHGNPHQHCPSIHADRGRKMQAKQNCVTEVSMARISQPKPPTLLLMRQYRSSEAWAICGSPSSTVVSRCPHPFDRGGTTEIWKEIIAKQLGSEPATAAKLLSGARCRCKSDYFVRRYAHCVVMPPIFQQGYEFRQHFRQRTLQPSGVVDENSR